MNKDSERKIPIDSYRKIVKIDAGGRGLGFIQKPVLKAKEYLQKTFPNLDSQVYLLSQQDKEIQDRLLDSVSIGESCLHEDYLIDFFSNSEEGTCLRCYVSHFILQACQQRFIRFSLGGQRFQLHELLPIVLNDDGKPLPSVEIKERFIPYSFQILQEYIKRKPRTSLDKWVLMKTKQSDAIEKFLLELGICTDSDWAILNATKLAHLEKVFREFHIFSPNAIQHLSESEIQRARAILESFHKIYRGDRQRNHQYGRCQPPTATQLQRMIGDLWTTQQIQITPPRLMDELKAIANRLRDYRLCEYQPPHIPIPDYLEIPDTNSFNNLKSEDEEDLRALLSPEKLIPYLDKSIDEGFCDVINSLSTRCTHLKKYIKPAFYYLCCQGMTQKETASHLGISQSQISRYIQPLIPKHRQQVSLRIQKNLLKLILNKVKGWNIVENLEQRKYFDNLVCEIEVYVENKIFLPTDGVNSLYSKRLCVYLSKYKEM